MDPQSCRDAVLVIAQRRVFLTDNASTAMAAFGLERPVGQGKSTRSTLELHGKAGFAVDVSLSHGDASLLARQVNSLAFSYRGLVRPAHATLISDSENLLLHGRRISHWTE